MRPCRALPVRIASLLGDRRGASTVEYGLILAFIVLMMFGALQGMSAVTVDMWNDISAKATSSK